MFIFNSQFNSIQTLQKQSQQKFLEGQICHQKYLISDSDRNRTLNEAMRLLQQKKISDILILIILKAKIHKCQQCQKQFQSLTALTTHSKKQHPTVQLINGERKRGRPRRDARPNDHITQWQQQQMLKEKELQPKRKPSLTSLKLEQMIAFKKFQKCERYTDQEGLISNEMLEEKDSISRLLEMLQPVQEEHELIKTIEEFSVVEEQDFLIEEFQPIIKLYAAFLVNLGCFCTDKLLRLMIIFIKALINYTNTQAQQYLLKNTERDLLPVNNCQNKLFKLIPTQNDRIFHEIMPLQLFPLICNNFLSFLPTQLQNFDSKFATLILRDICDWLYSEIKGFKVSLNI